ncbi:MULTISPECIES: LysE family translocator [unclassified Streptomyces]|uniref:LysE family translocator n=1 Tax=unclassified Streptomyces TaxID=2593676 RepID=UPI003701C521
MNVTFLLTTLVVVVTPGTGVLYTLAAGLAHGRRTGVVAAFGCTLAGLPHLLAAVTGLAALLQAGSVAFTVVKYLGAAYLLYMAWSMLRDRSALVVEQDPAPRPAARVIGSAVLVNLLNPKPALFFLAFLPQFVPAGDIGAMLRLGGVFMAMTFAVFTAYALCAAALRERLPRRPGLLTGMRRGFAACFVALSLRLAVA